jgi:hypothetical protein
MSGITGYPHQDKLVNPLLGYDEVQSKPRAQYVTAHENSSKQVLADVQMHGVFRSSAVASAIDSVDTVYPKQVVHSTAHGAVKGDFVRFEVGSANEYIQAMVIYVPDADTIVLGTILPSDILITDTFFILKSVMPVYDSGGALSVSSGPLKFIKDAVTVDVTEDTAVPANDIPLPVKIVAGGSGSYAEIVNLAAVAQTFTAPAGAVGFILETDSSNTNNVRYKIGAVATITSGMKMEPGRDTGYIPCAANISVIAEAGTNQVVTVQWILKV